MLQNQHLEHQYDDLEQKIMQFLDAHNIDPKPFVWTKTAETILEKVERAKAALT